jgi:dolichyl-diphosphooligosaccharide--protein glycosyltransferase
VAYYPLTLIVFGLVAIMVFYVVDPSLLKSMVQPFGFFTPAGAALTIAEVRPLLFPEGDFSLSTALYNFTTGIFFSIISLGILVYLVIKQNSPDKNLLIVWSLIMLAATLSQRRYAYYFAVNIALLTGYLSWIILQYFGFRKTMAETVRMAGNAGKKLRQRKKREQKSRRPITRTTMVLGVVVVFVIVFYPNIGPLPQIGPWPAGAMPAVDTGRYAVFASDAWYESLDWMNNYTPDPFDDPDFYYEHYEPPPSGESYKYPESAYGIMAWWDYGHMITRVAHRIPVSNPHQYGAADAAQFFTSQDESSANKICDRLGVRYVIVDNDTSTIKFHGGIVTFAGHSPEKFFELYFQPQDGKLKGDYFFYSEYYRSLAARLYNFNGSQVIPEHSLVIHYAEKVFPDGEPFKEIISLQTFPIYEAAVNYVEKQGPANYRIVGRDPFVSPVPLEPFQHYELIYSSDDTVMQPDAGMIPVVKIFKYEK